MAFDLRGAFAAIGTSAADAATAAAAAQAKGAYGTSLDVPAGPQPVKTGQLDKSLPTSTTAVAQPGFLAKYGKMAGIAAIVGLVVLLVVMRKKRR